MKVTFSLLTSLAAGSLVAASAAAQTTAPSRVPTREQAPTRETAKPAAAATKNIVQTAVAAGDFKTLAQLLTAADLVSALEGPGPFTVFAPNDAAFAKLPPEVVKELLDPANKARLQAVLKYHVVPAKAMAKDVSGMTFAKTLQGQRVNLLSSGGTVKVDNATVIAADIVCSNGVIHAIDTVLLPQEGNLLEVAKEARSFTTLLAAIDAAGIGEIFRGAGPFTVFAPTDDAFKALPAGTLDDLLKPESRARLIEILSLHVVPSFAAYSDDVVQMTRFQTLNGQGVPVVAKDGAVRVGNAKVVKTDIEASNGVIHVIDAVILPAPATNSAR